MRTAVILTLILSLSLNVFAQKKKKSEAEPEQKQEMPQKESSEYQMQKSIALMALKYNDAMVAKQALYNMIALAPERTDLIDSLALLYFQMGSYTECILVAREILEKQPDKTSILEVKAISEQNLGLAKLALEDYEKLYPVTKNIYHLYQIATLQYDLKRFGECDVTIQRLMADEKLKETKIQIFLGQGQSQEVPMEAGIYNMQGMLLLNINKETEAKERFNKALEMAPEFVLPKNNLAALEKSNKDK
jgi:tetratricopeptide (TPR) repeat protein